MAAKVAEKTHAAPLVKLASVTDTMTTTVQGTTITTIVTTTVVNSKCLMEEVMAVVTEETTTEAACTTDPPEGTMIVVVATADTMTETGIEFDHHLRKSRVRQLDTTPITMASIRTSSDGATTAIKGASSLAMELAISISLALCRGRRVGLGTEINFPNEEVRGREIPIDLHAGIEVALMIDE